VTVALPGVAALKQSTKTKKGRPKAHPLNFSRFDNDTIYQNPSESLGQSPQDESKSNVHPFGP
jgi:hypothetical protein